MMGGGEGSNKGLIPRLCQQLFATIEEVRASKQVMVQAGS